MITLEQAGTMYNEITDVIDKYKNDCIIDVSFIQSKIDKHLFCIWLNEKHGININPDNINKTSYIPVGSNGVIMDFRKNRGDKIPSPDDGKQPDDGYLYKLSFSTGAYTFGDSWDDDYPEEFFNKFFTELKTYKPDYIDSKNSGLYWRIENAKVIYNSFNSILSKYIELNNEDKRQRKIKKMKEDLIKLEKQNK